MVLLNDTPLGSNYEKKQSVMQILSIVPSSSVATAFEEDKEPLVPSFLEETECIGTKWCSLEAVMAVVVLME